MCIRSCTPIGGGDGKRFKDLILILKKKKKKLLGERSVPSLSTRCTPCNHLLSSHKLGSFHWKVKNAVLE